MGGEGFTGEGWTTAESPPLGDPRAVKGGTFRFSIMEFPPPCAPWQGCQQQPFNNLLGGMVYESLIGTHLLPRK
jgi:hypothetical protein